MADPLQERVWELELELEQMKDRYLRTLDMLLEKRDKPETEEWLIRDIIERRDNGCTWQEIADVYNTHSVPTARGNEWGRASVRYLYSRWKGCI